MNKLSRLASLCVIAFAALPAPGAAQAVPDASIAAGTARSKAATAPGKPGDLPSKRSHAKVRSEAAADAPAVRWHDGERSREIRIDPARVADFRAPPPAGKSAVVRARSDAEKAAPGLPAGVSPVFVDPDAAGQIRALPGGVIVTLKQPPAGNDVAAREEQARRQLADAGIEPLRPIGPDARRWLVASPPGMPALELANRLQESGVFESASPNWWKPRALK